MLGRVHSPPCSKVQPLACCKGMNMMGRGAAASPKGAMSCSVPDDSERVRCWVWLGKASVRHHALPFNANVMGALGPELTLHRVRLSAIASADATVMARLVTASSTHSPLPHSWSLP